MPRGGKRPGAGRKATRPPAKRRLMLELDASEAAQLDALQARLGRSSAVAVIREAIGFLALDVARNTRDRAARCGLPSGTAVAELDAT